MRDHINTPNFRLYFCIYRNTVLILLFFIHYRNLKRSLCLVQSVCRPGSAVEPGFDRPNWWRTGAPECLICPVTDALYALVAQSTVHVRGLQTPVLDRFQHWFLYAIAVNLNYFTKKYLLPKETNNNHSGLDSFFIC